MYYTNIALRSFYYKNQLYKSGTKLIYNGECYLNGCKTALSNQVVTYMYHQYGQANFLYNNNIYTCPSCEFSKRIVKIGVDIKPTPSPIQQETEFYWTDAMVTKTIWYVIIMLVAVIFNDCIGIWILATIVWYNSVFNNKK